MLLRFIYNLIFRNKFKELHKILKQKDMGFDKVTQKKSKEMGENKNKTTKKKSKQKKI